MELEIAAMQNKRLAKIIKSDELLIPNKLQISPKKFNWSKFCGLESTVKNGITIANENISANPEIKVKTNKINTWDFLLL